MDSGAFAWPFARCKAPAELRLREFVNAYYQVHDCMSYAPRRVLVIGPGQGFEPLFLREYLKLDVTTLDVEPDYQPDYLGSVHVMNMFADGQFDVAIASHVLEHMPFSYFEPSLAEIARVADHAVIYLPYAGMHYEIRLIAHQFYREHSLCFTRPPIRSIDGTRPVLCGEQHYWECGFRGFGVRTIRGLVSRYFEVDRMYQNRDFKFSLNFGLTSRRVDGEGS